MAGMLVELKFIQAVDMDLQPHSVPRGQNWYSLKGLLASRTLCLYGKTIRVSVSEGSLPPICMLRYHVEGMFRAGRLGGVVGGSEPSAAAKRTREVGET